MLHGITEAGLAGMKRERDLLLFRLVAVRLPVDAEVRGLTEPAVYVRINLYHFRVLQSRDRLL